MPKFRLCKGCKKRKKDVSGNSYCMRCATNKSIVVATQMHKKKGNYYKKWKLNTMDAIKKLPM